ncbi:GSCOCG00005158001-RA-CDS [Cotesia congregata]|nr:GSCOCG00005158001-RA-CDS [Cotesia congregata]
MSNIRSASSSTKYVHLRRLVVPRSRKSISLPGVAITISTPRSRSRAWLPLGAPPKMHGDGSVSTVQRLLVVDVNDSRQDVPKRLSGSCLSNTDHVAAGHCNGPTLGLNSRRLGEPLSLNSLHYVIREVSFIERLDWVWNFLSFKSNFFFLSERIDFAVVSLGNLGFFRVLPAVLGLFELPRFPKRPFEPPVFPPRAPPNLLPPPPPPPKPLRGGPLLR